MKNVSLPSFLQLSMEMFSIPLVASYLLFGSQLKLELNLRFLTLLWLALL